MKTKLQIAIEYAEKSELLVYVSHISCHQPRGIAGYQGADFATFFYMNLCNQKNRRIGISLGSPYVHFDFYADFDCFINAYNTLEATQRAVVKAIYGEIPFEGGEPFKVIPKGFDVNY